MCESTKVFQANRISGSDRMEKLNGRMFWSAFELYANGVCLDCCEFCRDWKYGGKTPRPESFRKVPKGAANGPIFPQGKQM
jgi:hypothetical protein